MSNISTSSALPRVIATLPEAPAAATPRLAPQLLLPLLLQTKLAIMLKKGALAALQLLLAAGAVAQYDNSTSGPDEDGKYLLEAEGIRAYFIPYGAAITNLFVTDAGGVERDIVLGYDNASYYSIDEKHPYYGGVPGKFFFPLVRWLQFFWWGKEPNQLTFLPSAHRPVRQPHQEQHVRD